ncbi:glycyl-radical enzyme activating protein [Desulfofustis glycolicus]|uniref:Pyruvate formate lyase activating enzyme n=1 Tax=Desulfofustis glycolicus DSM 9705 TaxID=1121409 RepID=A0A1M5U7Y9_9BACT|nr:glycyl-radical enzyme activating protein [Desulfofustis glycolicus]MCB2214608.1 glycyl-radical enzyme activating protein [Desulfobulbaceae bacterium]SHH58966.1 pyruvate formate lyase activating enzyme [Desulfofustis glycolicus DSM 9705]
MGSVFAIKKYAIHDGPNIRLTIFFKGCPLRCWWCHNPEGLEKELSVIWIKDKCIGCGECLTACPTGSLKMVSTGILRDLTTCEQNRACVSVCPALAHEAIGWEASVEEIISEIEKDTPFYDESGGGVTFSGGEPLMQPEFLLELLRQCGRLDIHRVVDTSAFAKTELLLQVAEQCELFLIDLKHMDPEKHKIYTGVDNGLILENIRTLAHRGVPFRIRIPLIEGVNSDQKNLRLSSEFLAGLPCPPGVDLLPYHNIAESKYRKMNRDYPAVQFQPSGREKVAAWAEMLTDRGLHVRIGG